MFILSFICCLTLTLKAPKLFELIDSIEGMVAETDSKCIVLRFPIWFCSNIFMRFKVQCDDRPTVSIDFKKTLWLIEVLRKFVYIFSVYVTIPCFLSPKVIISLYFYYVKGFGRDSFELPISMWWVNVLLFQLNWNKIFKHLTLFVYFLKAPVRMEKSDRIRHGCDCRIYFFDAFDVDDSWCCIIWICMLFAFINRNHGNSTIFA